MLEQDIDYRKFIEEYNYITKIAGQGMAFASKYPDTYVIVKASKKIVIAYTPFDDKRTLDHVYIRGIYVSPEFRKTGLASRLIKDLVKKCKENNISSIQVEPFDESISFFIKMGFIEMPGHKNNRMKLNVLGNIYK